MRDRYIDLNFDHGREMGLESKQPVIFGLHIALFIDLLGQKNELDKLPLHADLSKEEEEKAIELVSNTIGKVLEVSNYFNWANKRFSENPESVAGTETPLRVQYFSDSILFSCPVFNDDKRINLHKVLCIFTSSALSLLTSLARGNPFRGGIDVGYAVTNERIGLYGPLMKRIYELENRIAGYPRIVVGDHCLEFLHKCSQTIPIDDYTKGMKVLGELIENDFICRDANDCSMIDFLGKGVYRNNKNMKVMDARPLIGSAYKFARDMRECYKDLANHSPKTEKDEAKKLLDRYQMLLEYISERKNALWKE